MIHMLPTIYIWKKLMMYIPDKSWLDYQAKVTIKRWNCSLQWLAQLRYLEIFLFEVWLTFSFWN